MQGRVLPKDVNKLQVFPDQWQEELGLIRECGFSHVELLDDKENRLRELLLSSPQHVFGEIEKHGLSCSSVCADQLCNSTLLQESSVFLESVKELLEMFKGHGGFTIVIPFFDKNKLQDEQDLKIALNYLGSLEDDLANKHLRLALEIDLDASSIARAWKDFSSKAIGICYDIGNNIGHGYDIYEQMMMLREWLIHVHVKDKQDNVNIRLRKNLAQLQSAFQALGEIGYEDLLTLETCMRPEPFQEARENFATVKEYLSSVHSV